MLLHIVMTQLFLNSKKSLGNKIKISYLASLFLGILLSVASSMKTELSFWKQNKEF